MNEDLPANNVLKKAARLASEVMRKYYDKSTESYVVAVLLDPRFKLEYYRNSFRGYDVSTCIPLT